MTARMTRNATALLLGAGIVFPAWAQEATPPGGARSAVAAADPSPADTDAADDIVVTARRREENIAKVPIAITAIGRQALAARSIFSENDLQSAVPGLTIRQNGNANQFNYSIRGQSVDTYTNSPPGVLPYIDEVQVATHAAMAFYDLDGIQVLKGPQGTLFGRNTTGGAVLYQTAKPGDSFGGYVDARYGSYDSRHVEGAVSVPLSPAAGLRIAASYTGGGAYVRDIDTGKHFGDQNQKSVRGTLLLRPGTALTNSTVVQYSRDRGTNTPSEAFSSYACGSSYQGTPLYSAASCVYGPGSPAFAAFVAAHPNIYQGGVDAFTARQNALGPWKADVNYPLFHRARSLFAINTTTWTVSPDLTVKNILGYNKSTSDDGFDYDGTPYPIFQAGGTPTADATSATDLASFGLSTRQFSEEFQLQGKALGDRLVYVVGIYYLDQRDIADSNLLAFDFSPVAAGVTLRYHQRSVDRSLAGFAQASYKLTDRLNLTGGFRYSEDRQSARQLAGSIFGPAEERIRSHKPSWTASIDYQATPALLLYATTRGSWRTGGFNYSVAPIPLTAAQGGNVFRPETTEDVEIGAKYSGRVSGVPVTLNVDVFDQWVSDIQRAAYVVGAGGSPTLLTVNVPKAEITGVEADFSIRPAPWLQLGASGAYTDARYTDGRLALLGSTLSYGPFADTPKLTGTAFVEASRPLGAGAGALRLRADVYAQSRMNFSNVGATIAPGTTIPSYTLVNARLAWSELMGTRLTASVFVRNLFDRKYYAGGNAVGPSLGINTVNPGQPRIIGGELRAEF